jgi:hypothetical protein
MILILNPRNNIEKLAPESLLFIRGLKTNLLMGNVRSY